jgi:hypothetical protein
MTSRTTRLGVLRRHLSASAGPAAAATLPLDEPQNATGARFHYFLRISG